MPEVLPWGTLGSPRDTQSLISSSQPALQMQKLRLGEGGWFLVTLSRQCLYLLTPAVHQDLRPPPPSWTSLSPLQTWQRLPLPAPSPSVAVRMEVCATLWSGDL